MTIMSPPTDESGDPLSRVQLNAARVSIGLAGLRLARWHRGGAEDKPGDVYVAAGHDAVGHIDEALKALHAVRAALISELRKDQDERAVRVDAMLADIKERRQADAAVTTVPRAQKTQTKYAMLAPDAEETYAEMLATVAAQDAGRVSVDGAVVAGLLGAAVLIALGMFGLLPMPH